MLLDRIVTAVVVMILAAAPMAAQTALPPQYVGPGSCSSSTCHGSVPPRTDARIPQDEYSIWVLQDKHAKAYGVLANQQSQRIARNLRLNDKPQQSHQCLGCHALDVPAAQKARPFDFSDGVGCESCHGPASKWLGPHTARNWTHEQSVAVGMFDTKNLIRRSEKCLSCHLGNQDQEVTHEMIAAGHPDLLFELDSYTAVMPRHWKEPLDQDPYREVRAWSVGQAVQLREALTALARRAGSTQWPEYAEYDCASCHHPLVKPDESWRQQFGYDDRTAGTPPWNPQGYQAFRQLVREVDASSASQLDTELKEVAGNMNRLQQSPRAISDAATRAASAADTLATRLNGMSYSRELTIRVLHNIVADADSVSATGERSAEQATMAVDSLLLACNPPLPRADAIQAAVAGLFKQLENPSSYNARTFAAQMKAIAPLLP